MEVSTVRDLHVDRLDKREDLERSIGMLTDVMVLCNCSTMTGGYVKHIAACPYHSVPGVAEATELYHRRRWFVK